MKLAIIFILIILCAFSGAQFYKFSVEKKSLSADFSKINNDLKKTEEENRNLDKDLSYFSDPENAIKEIRSKFNLRHPDEKMFIIVSPTQR